MGEDKSRALTDSWNGKQVLCTASFVANLLGVVLRYKASA
jgi:hypothetical protein